MNLRSVRRYRRTVLCSSVAAAVLLAGSAFGSQPVRAAGSPTYRDCSLLIGVDPDFIQLYGATLNRGMLNVPVRHAVVQLQASESSDPGDGANRVSFQVAVTAKGVGTVKAQGAGTGEVVLALALPSPRHGRSYTISWSATFDNGEHACPAVYDFDNQQPSPFVVTTT